MTATATSKAKTKTKRRPRKSTFVVRKEEKQRLEKELARLQAQWRALHTADAPDGEGDAEADTSDGPPDAEATRPAQRAAPRAVATALRDRHLVFNGLRSLLSAYFISHHTSAAYDAIHLPSDAAARRRVLMMHSAPKIRDARLVMLERCRFLDLSRPQTASECFESEDGDMFMLQFDVTPFGGLPCSVRAVHDAVGFYAQNVEIYVSERIGDLTIREDNEVDASTDARVSQRRVVSTTAACGLTIDANVAVFRQHFAEGACPDLEAEHSVMVTHSVETDELYPYVPGERVRHDLTSCMIIQQVTDANGQRMTTLVRSVLVKRYTRGVAMDPCEDVHTPMRTLAAQWDQLMLMAVKERLIAEMVAARTAAVDSNSAASSPASSVGSS